MLRLSLAEDSGRAIYALSPFSAVALLFTYMAARLLLQAVGDRSDVEILLAGVLFGSALVTTILVVRSASTMRVRLVELARLRYDTDLINLASELPLQAWLDDAGVTELVKRARSSAPAIADSPRVVGWLVDGLFGVVVSAAFLFAIQPALTLVVLGAVPAILLHLWGQGRVASARLRAEADDFEMRRCFTLATDLAYAEDIRILGIEGRLLGAHASAAGRVDRELSRAEFVSGSALASGWLIAAAAFGIGLAAAVGSRSGPTPGDIFVALAVMAGIVTQMGGAARGIGSMRETASLYWPLLELQRLQRSTFEARRQRRHQTLPTAPVASGLQVAGLTYRYASSTSPALQGISFVAQAGKVIGVAGENGAGKSTLSNLLLGVYEPTEGSVSFDGEPLDTSHVVGPSASSACFQDFARFEFTLADSIAIGNHGQDVDDRDVFSTLQRLFPDGSDLLHLRTDVQLGARFGGRELSGGEWQRIALARALIDVGTRLVVLDEPSSALDPIAEATLLEGYIGLVRERAEETGAVVIVISHRFTSLAQCDDIILLDEGKILQLGSHSDLVATEGKYAELFDQQAKRYNDRRSP